MIDTETWGEKWTSQSSSFYTERQIKRDFFSVSNTNYHIISFIYNLVYNIINHCWFVITSDLLPS